MKLIYIAGRFSGPTRADVERNIVTATHVGLEVARAGAMPVIPHSMTAHPDFERVQPYEFWIEGTLRQLDSCDAVMCVPGWETSKGAMFEVARAITRKMPVFERIEELKAWLKAGEAAA